MSHPDEDDIRQEMRSEKRRQQANELEFAETGNTLYCDCGELIEDCECDTDSDEDE